MIQPSQDALSTPRRPLDVEDYIDIVRRHKGWILGPAFAGLVLSVVGAFLWPDTYVSQAAIRVVPAQVPERFVPTNVNMEMSQHIAAMTQTVTSRPALQNIIQTFGLYPKEVKRKPLADVAEDMRKDVHIGPVLSMQSPSGRTPLSAFSISFEYPDRRLAQKVAADLVSRFINENIASRSSQSRDTTQFLTDELAMAKKELDDLENRRTQFRLANAGRLPDELQVNLQTLRSLETQLAGVNEAISRIDQDKLLLESQIRIYRDQLASLGSIGDQVGAQVKNERLTQMEKDILTLETALSGLRERYKDDHPDVQRAKSQLAAMKRMRDDLLKQEEQKQPQQAVAKIKNPLVTQASKEMEANIARLQSQVQAKNLELDERVKEQTQLKNQINGYSSRIQSSPITERQYSDLTRDYTLAKTRYDDLNTKLTASQMATNLEARKAGENLEILDPANLPEQPAKPNRWLIVGAGLGIGLMLGVFIAGAREVKDSSLKSLKDARAYTNLPVLGTVPLLENDLVVRRKRRLAWLAWSAACMLGILAMTTSVYYYFSTRT